MNLHELEHGVLLGERSDPRQGAVLRRWLDGSVVHAFKNRVLPIDQAVAMQAAALSVPDPRPFRDGLIAATGLIHCMPVVTRNVGDFEGIEGVQVVDPWT